MTTKEKAISIWNQFELSNLDMTYQESLDHSEIVVKNIIDFIGEEVSDDNFERTILIDYYNEVLNDLRNIYKFKKIGL